MILSLWGPGKDEDVAPDPPRHQPGAAAQPGQRPDAPHGEATGGPEGEAGPSPHHLGQEYPASGQTLFLR